MPELPEVEIIVRDLRAAKIEGKVITAASVHYSRIVEPLSSDVFCDYVVGKRIEKVSRRGKYIVIMLSGGYVMCVHLRMSGHLFLGDAMAYHAGKHDQVVVKFNDGRLLRYHDPRKFGRIMVTAVAEAPTKKLGPEPLEMSSSDLATILGNQRRGIKTVLLDQTIIVGLGNIYVDEALWEAGIHPLIRAADLSEPRLVRLHCSIRKVLERGIKHRGTSLGKGIGNYKRLDGDTGQHQHQLRVYGRSDQPCGRCGSSIERIRLGGRSTHFCPACQPAP